MHIEDEKRSTIMSGRPTWRLSRNKLLKRIFMVHDEPDINPSLRDHLKQGGFKITPGSSRELIITCGSYMKEEGVLYAKECSH